MQIKTNITAACILLLLLLPACGGMSNREPYIYKNMDKSFDEFKEEFIESLWKAYPNWASSVGYHKYDSMLVVPDENWRKTEKEFIQSWYETLHSFDKRNLSEQNTIDHQMIDNQLNLLEFNVMTLKAWEWDPSSYNVCGVFADMLYNNYEPLDNRVRNFYKRMENIPAYYEAAKNNIKNPTIEHTLLAIEQNEGGISVFTTDLEEALGKVNFDEKEKNQVRERAKIAVQSIQGYADFLKALKNDTPRSFRLGRGLYSKKFELEIQSAYLPEDVYQMALDHKKDLHKKMSALAVELWPKYMGNTPQPKDTLVLIRQVIDKISLKHTTPDSFQEAIENQIPKLVEFIKTKDLIYIDPEKPLVVRREPDYMAGVAGASISAPGPYDQKGNTYYNVGSLSGWGKDRAESYLREYNHYILQILNIHEAIPGHYTQLIYSNQSPSIIKSIFGNGAMIEGWAVYTEIMMLENGYENSPEMWLMYYKWNLRSTCNTILDYSVHNGDMTREQAMDLLMKEAFQQQAEAEGKWKRVTLTQVQLCSYFTGYREIYNFREEMKKEMGKDFNLKKFHEKFLSYGSAPVRYIRELMKK